MIAARVMAKPRSKKRGKASKVAAHEVDARFATVIDALANKAGVVVEPGWGKGNFVLKVNAKIFAILSTDRCVAKLPKARVDELVAGGVGTRFDPRKNGRVMKEWIVVADQSRWRALAREAHEFVMSGIG
jgi:hypothetical protein